jgi:acetyltransferase-like isoleucine patch superfamily enzyme
MGARAREVVKAVVRGLSLVAVAPALCSFRLRSWIIGPDRALQGSTQALALLPGIVGQYLRRAFLARTLARCAESATIEFGTIFSSVGARIDDLVYIGPHCSIGLVHFEAGVLVGPAVHVPSGRWTHGISDPSKPIRDQPGHQETVRIGAGSWVGSGAVVMADVGPNTVVGAGAVVTRPLPADAIVGGVPARVLRHRGAPTVARLA